jgi:LDH2 family malate/lactate/ureidoglycolate dehydrogenase
MSEQSSPVVAAESLTRFCADCFLKLGLSQADAELTARSLVWASLRGVDSHGLVLMKEYAERISLGSIDPRSAYTIISETATTGLIDAAGGVGQVAGFRAMSLAMEKASQAGVGVVGVRNSNHFGAAAFYSQLAVERNMIGLASTNAPPTMAPWGGKARLLGTNPLSIAVPAGAYPALVLDMATSASAWGKVFIAMQQGKKIPLTWVLDKNGEPTDDPAIALDDGLIQPLGGYKGYGLSLMLEILTGVLTGSAFSSHIPAWNNKDQPLRCGHLLAAVRIDCFLSVEVFHTRMEELVALMKNGPVAAGSDRIYVPGEIEFETERQRREQGIPLHSALEQDLTTLGRELGIATPF